MFLFGKQYLFGQNINGFVIPISKDIASSLSFHSEVTGWRFAEKTYPYKISTLDVKTIMIETSQDVSGSYNFFVEEGGRRHHFILVFKDKNDVDPSERDKDYSDLKQLSKDIQASNNTLTASKTIQPAQSNTTPDVVQKTTAQDAAPTNQISNTTNSTSTSNSTTDSKYALLDAAEKAKNNKNYKDAIAKYQQVLQIDPGNSFAATGLQEVNKLISDASGQQYSNAILKANNAYTDSRYDEALKYYNDALAMQPNDVYSKNQIELIQKKQVAAKIEAVNRQSDSLFNSYINAGDKALSTKSYDEAMISYNEALKIKPGDVFANGKMNAVKQKKYDDSVAAIQKTQDALYTSYLNSGNKAMQEKLYNEARMAYKEALKVKPNDLVATSKINSIDNQIESDSIESARNKNQGLHDNFIKSGDEAFKQKSYDVAKSDYNEALKIIPDDKHAKDQIKSIDDALDNIRIKQQKDLEAQKGVEQQKKYTDLITTADNYYNSEMYAEAKSKYAEALLVNSTDTYSKNKITGIDNIFAQQKEKHKQDSLNSIKYTSIIIKADKDFDSKNYTSAQAGYQNALKLKSDDQYAKDKLAQIQTAFQEVGARSQAIKDSITKAAEVNKEYSVAVVKAKTAYNKNDYVMARGFYVSANSLKPDEAEPKNKIADIDNKLNTIMALQEQKANYDSVITLGETALIDSDYNGAIQQFSQALTYNQQDDGYANKQIKYAKYQIALKDSLTNLITKKEEQRKNVDSVMAFYTKGKDDLKVLNYQDALISYKQFVNGVEYIGSTSSQYNFESLEKFSKSKINDIQAYLARPKDTTVRKLPDIKTLPSYSIITYHNEKDPKLNFVYNKYPDISFEQSPPNQLFDSISDYGQENKLISKDVMSSTPKTIAEGVSDGINLICQNIVFIGSKTYLKFMIQNTNDSEYITGSMLLTLKIQDGKSIRMLPSYVAGYPIVLAKKEKVIVYVTKTKTISDNDNLSFELSNRLNASKVIVNIPGSAYNHVK